MLVTTILGSNSGNKRNILSEAIQLLSSAGQITQQSALYETEPWGFTSNENFLNQVVVFETELSPREFLNHCLTIEKRLGRVRYEDGPRYSSRPIDIDILFCDSRIINSPELIVPHPRIAERRFVLAPLAEIMPDFVHPVFRKTIAELLSSCPDTLVVKKL